MDFIINNKEWLFSGLAIAIISFIGKLIYNNYVKGSKESDSSKNTNTNTNKVVVNNNIKVLNTKPSSEKNSNGSNGHNSRYKEITRILFVDDDVKFKVVNILKKAGWINTKSKKDIVNLDDNDAKESDIIFVDINGVGTELFQDQGLGLAYALKTKYPEKKIVIYSAESNGDRFHKAFRITDDCLSKNAEPYEFIHLVETFSNEIFAK